MALIEKILTRRSLVIGVLLLMTMAGYYVPLVLGEDPGFGLAVWNDMLSTGQFNTLLIPSPENIAQNQSLFLTWWSPGQYMVPGALSELLNISPGMASLWITLAFSVAGLMGWYFVYQWLEFDKTTIALGLFFIATSRLFTINFLNYTGGELLLFGSQPWTIWCFLKYRRQPFILFGGLLVLSLVSFFLKTAYTIGLAALCGCAGIAFLNDFRKQKKLFIPAFWTALAVGLCMVFYLALTQLGFINLGTSPITSTNQPFNISWTSFETLTYPLTHWFSIAEIYPQLLIRTDFPEWGHSLYYSLMAVSFLGLIWVMKQSGHDEARWLFLGFYLVYCGIFLLLYNKGAEISVEYRHTKVVAYLFLPLLLGGARRSQVSARWVLGTLIILNSGYGLSTFILKKVEIRNESATGSSGFALRHAEEEDLAFIHAVDKPENILYFTSGSLNVDAVKARKLVGSIDLKFAKGCGFLAEKYDGKAGKIYAFVHEAYQQIPTNPTLESQFPAYRFRLVRQTKKFKIYEGI
ncbi:hypothetical protein [Runella aurantiaca]|uniref:Glycosyltransferase RgtA/B/C/D-like domain-containing protein n=1 Tax=Runella aurantiaca TaxID=2282308 RepID=A0A369I6A9_9BACT|nr:hypothetical protein [Runella aurantiaca]RDB04582.1 hypothetical protein DVG78_18000 [Runella aurantiaca]